MITKTNKILTICLSVISIFIISACSKNVDFGNINQNPNEPNSIQTNALLTSAIKDMPLIVSSVQGTLYVQHISEITYTEDSRYETVQWSYDTFYSDPLNNLQLILTSLTENPDDHLAAGDKDNQMAVAKLLKAYMFHHMTDRWGMIPYTEALQGQNILKPKFDTQESIYNSLFTEIDEALALINPTSPLKLTGDIMFNGDMHKWKMFGNTLKLVMALRVADVHPDAKDKFNQAYTAGVIDSVSNNMHFPYLTDDANDNPWQDRFESRQDYAVSDILVDHLTTHNDPRLPFFAELPDADTTNTYKGMPYGKESPGILATTISLITDKVIQDGTQAGGMVFTYAQVAFSMAEAAQRGWTTVGDAKTWYELGIKASMDQWGVSNSDASAYINAHPFENSKAMELIGTEKWVALYLQGYEAWAEWRRLDYPILSPAPDALTGNGIPVRQGYSALTKALNTTNYQSAVSAQGADNQDTKLWWDNK